MAVAAMVQLESGSQARDSNQKALGRGLFKWVLKRQKERKGTEW